MDIAQVRAQYPQYSDLSDEELLRGLHGKYYSDMSYEDFATNFAQPSPVEQRKSYYQNLMDMVSGGTQAAGEVASGANASAMGFLDLLAKTGNVSAGGYNALLRFMQGKPQGEVRQALNISPIPMPSDVAEAALGERPGEQVMESGTGQQLLRAAGATIPAALGMRSVSGRDITRLPGQVAELSGFGSQAPAQTVGQITGTAEDLARLGPQSPEPIPADLPKKVARTLALKRGGEEAAGAGYKLDKAGKVIEDPAQQEALKQGFEPGFVTMVKSSPKAAKDKMKRMVGVIKRGKQNYRYAVKNRPGDMVGESVVDRIKIVKAANKIAGNKLTGEADKLKGEYVDFSPAINQFMDDLETKLGVVFDPQTGKVNYSESALEGLDGIQAIINRTLKRLYNTKSPPSAFDVHRAKQYLSEQVDYGKTTQGMSGRVETIIKSLRHNLDSALDDAFPDYNQVNTQYSDTIRALNDLQDAAGRKINFYGPNADKALGVTMRRLMSNYSSRIPLEDAINNLDSVAARYMDKGAENSVVPYGTISRVTGLMDLNDDMTAQIKFVDELDKLFGTHASTSFQGDITKSVTRAMGQSKREVAANLAERGIQKLRGINEENAMKALLKLLEED